MELTTILDIFRRRKWVIIQAVLVIGLSAYIGSHFISPSYQTSTKILIKRAKRGAEEGGRELVGLPGLSSMIIRTHADVDVNKILGTSTPYIDEMIHKLQLRDANGNLLKAGKLLQTGIASTIRGKIFAESGVISISQYAGTAILEIKATSSRPREAMMMSNTLADIMVEQNHEMIRSEYAIARTFLDNQMKKVRDRFTLALGEMTDFRKKEKTIDLKVETELASKNMAELLKQKEADVILLAQTRGKLTQVKSQLAELSPDFLPADTLNESPQIEILKKRIMNLELQLSQATSELTLKHPRVTALNEQIGVAKEELQAEIRVYQRSAPQLIALERQIAASEAHLEGVNADIDKFLADLGGIPDKVYRQETLGMELTVTQQIYRSLLDSLYEIRMGEASTLGEIRVVELAGVPLMPVSPNKTLNGILGIFLGLTFGVGLAFIMEYLDDRIRKPEDIKPFKPVGLIGMIPKFESEQMPLILAKDPNDPIYESYRKIRNYLKGGPVNVLLVTSPGPGEGRSTTAVNLGISVARERKKVLILDMDLRRPSLHTFFDLPNDVGMADLLQGKTSTDKAFQAAGIEGLTIIPSGLPFPDPGGLIESDLMGKLMSEFKTRFDVVILDSAPLLVKSDALVLAGHVDGSIIVVESERTTRQAVHELLDMAAKAGIKPLGFVLNGFSVDKGKHFYQRFYSGHYGEELSASESSA